VDLRTTEPSPAVHPTAGRPLAAEVLDDVSAVRAVASSWDALAVSASRPYAAPGWALPWWEQGRPPAADLRVITVREGPELVGLAPLCTTRDRWGVATSSALAGTVSSYTEPLASEGRQREVATAITGALSTLGRDVDVLSLRAVPHDSPWPGLLRETWPGLRPRLSLVATLHAPYVDLTTCGPDEWFGTRSRNFRQQIGRRTLEFERRGGRFDRAERPEEVLAGLDDLSRLHHGRWATRGGSEALGPATTRMLQEAGRMLGPGRLQLWTARANGRAVAVALFVAAGTQMHYWLGGFDEAWAALSPSVLLLVAAVRHAPALGCTRVSLGPGAQPYKYRLATGEDRLVWVDLLPRSARYPYVRLRQTPYRIRRTLANRTPPGTKQRVRDAVTRLHPVRRARRAGDDTPHREGPPEKRLAEEDRYGIRVD
jgi:CelD/BcsL family acetyltransferase involved in cellulose biosynthesis